jgi:hypothetical protein
MCEADKTFVTQICQIPGEDLGNLSLHVLLDYKHLLSNVTVKADYFRYLLNLYSNAASIESGEGLSPYNKAVYLERNGYSGIYSYFIRLLLNADTTMEP